jgi:hypothetical protein
MDQVSSLLLVGGQKASSPKSAPLAAQTGLNVEPGSTGSQSFQAALEQAQKSPIDEAELALAAQNCSGMLAGLMGLTLPVEDIHPPAAQTPEGGGLAAVNSAPIIQQGVSGQTTQVQGMDNRQPVSAQDGGVTTFPAVLTQMGMTGTAGNATTTQEWKGQLEHVPVPVPVDVAQTNHMAPPDQQDPSSGAGGAGKPEPDDPANLPPVLPPAGTEPGSEVPATEGEPGGKARLGPPVVDPGGEVPPVDENPGGVVRLGPPVTDPGGEAPPSDENPGGVVRLGPPVTDPGGEVPPATEGEPGGKARLGPPVIDPGGEAPPADENPGGVVRLGPPVSGNDRKETEPPAADKNRRIGPPILEDPLSDIRLVMPTEEQGQPSMQKELPIKYESGAVSARDNLSVKEKTNPGKDAPPPATAPPEADLTGMVNPTEMKPVKHELARLAEAHQPETLRQISSNLENLSRMGQGSFRLHLEPQDLGKIDLRFTNRADGLHVVMAASLPETGAMLERNLMDLRHSLTQMGVQVGDLSVSYGQANGQQATQHQGQHAGHGMHYQRGYASGDAGEGDTKSMPRFKTTNIDYLA